MILFGKHYPQLRRIFLSRMGRKQKAAITRGRCNSVPFVLFVESLGDNFYHRAEKSCDHPNDPASSPIKGDEAVAEV